MNKTIIKALAVLAALVTTSIASAITVNWGGASHFNSSEFTVPTSFTANTLTGITSANGYFHSHSSTPLTATLAARVNGAWVNVFSVTSTFSTFASAFSAPVSFAGGTITALRLSGSLNVNQTFHGWGTGDTFTFDSTSVPNGTSTLLLLGTALSGIALYRRRTA